MDGISDDDDLRDISLGCGLVDVMEHFDTNIFPLSIFLDFIFLFF